jgi:cell shape-determining protein MreD
MLRCVALLALAWLALLFNCGLASLVEVRGCAPSACLLAAALSISLSKGRHGILAAAWFGLAADLGGTGRLGIFMGCFALVGYAILRLRVSSVHHRLLRQGIELLLGTLAMSVSVACVQRLFAGTDLAWSALLGHSLGVSAYTALCALPFLIAAAAADGTSASLAPTP